MRLAPTRTPPPQPEPEPEPSDPDRAQGCRPRHRPRSRARSRQPSAEELRRSARAFARRSRAAQGLAPHIRDPEVIAKLVVLFRPTDPESESQSQPREEGQP
jgi:hypothetical protein